MNIQLDTVARVECDRETFRAALRYSVMEGRYCCLVSVGRVVACINAGDDTIPVGLAETCRQLDDRIASIPYVFLTIGDPFDE